MILLKLFHKLLLVGTPLFTYNPFSNLFNAPFNVEQYSTYFNFKLNDTHVVDLSNYIHQFNKTLNLAKVKISNNEEPNYYLSLNVYNVTSPLFMNMNKPITRYEINTYIKDETGNIGTVILDYCSNYDSIDPVNRWKRKSKTKFIMDNDRFDLKCIDTKSKFSFRCEFDVNSNDKAFKLSDELLKHTDNIYYKNGICDKLFYDSSLSYATTLTPKLKLIYFKYRKFLFSRIYPEREIIQKHSVLSSFYFRNKLNFVCSIWNNLW